jgi:CRP-like cAMP-binding protein
MNRNAIKCIQCGCKSLPFNELSNDELIQVNKNRIEITYKKGESIFKQNTMATHLAYIRKGLVKVSTEHGNQELVLSVETNGKFIGIQALYAQNMYPFSVVACEEVSVCLIDIQTISALVSTNAKFSATLLKLLNEDLLFSYSRMACLSLKQLHGRFADLLLCLSLRIYKRKKFSIPLSKKELSLIANMSQESLSRVIRDFITEKIIDFEGNEITILDFEKIRHLSLVG